MKKILIVEDDQFLSRMASKKLKENGYEVSVASDSNQAFEILKSQTPDMILLDLLLPGTDGFELLAKFKQNEKTKKIPILVFSNLSGEGDIKKCQDLGIRDFVVKSSCTLNELVDRVNKTTEENSSTSSL
ncbi:MAG TPA: response regulator, partial [Candidatus Paceibacterota bacterium]